MKKRLVLALMFVTSFFSCAKEEKAILPYVRINVVISLVDPEYIQITNPTTAIKITHYNAQKVGFLGNGIIVFNSGMDYYAYDATCTNEDHASLEIKDQIYAVCPKCNAKFNLISSYAEGNKGLRLQRYSIIESNNNLSIYN